MQIDISIQKDGFCRGNFTLIGGKNNFPLWGEGDEQGEWWFRHSFSRQVGVLTESPEWVSDHFLTSLWDFFPFNLLRKKKFLLQVLLIHME